jgi:hypothetical protein
MKSKKPPEVKRSDAYYGTTAAMRQVEVSIHAMLRRAALRDLLVRHRIGRILKDITRRPGIYDVDMLKVLADFTGIPGGVMALIDMKSFAIEFTLDFIFEQAATPTASGEFMCYGHYVALLCVKNLKRRQQFLDRTRAEGLTARQLQREIDKELKTRA